MCFSVATPGLFPKYHPVPFAPSVMDETPALPRLVRSRWVGPSESMGLIKDAEMSFSSEDSAANDHESKTEAEAVNPGQSRSSISLAQAKLAEMTAGRDQALVALNLAQKERDTIRVERDRAQRAIRISRCGQKKSAWEEVVRAGTAALEEERGVRTMIESMRSMLESMKID